MLIGSGGRCAIMDGAYDKNGSKGMSGIDNGGVDGGKGNGKQKNKGPSWRGANGNQFDPTTKGKGVKKGKDDNNSQHDGGKGDSSGMTAIQKDKTAAKKLETR